jgi:hypothetical protein
LRFAGCWRRDIIRWAAAAPGIVVAIMVVRDFSARITGTGFLIFTVSSIGWIDLAALKSEPPLAIQNSILLLVNMFGADRHMIVKDAKVWVANIGDTLLDKQRC